MSRMLSTKSRLLVNGCHRHLSAVMSAHATRRERAKQPRTNRCAQATTVHATVPSSQPKSCGVSWAGAGHSSRRLSKPTCLRWRAEQSTARRIDGPWYGRCLKDRPGRTASRQPAVYTCTPAQTASEPAPLLYCGWLAGLAASGVGTGFCCLRALHATPPAGYSALRPDLMRRSTPTIIHVQALHGHAWTGTAHAGRAGLTCGPIFFFFFARHDTPTHIRAVLYWA